MFEGVWRWRWRRANVVYSFNISCTFQTKEKWKITLNLLSPMLFLIQPWDSIRVFDLFYRLRLTTWIEFWIAGTRTYVFLTTDSEPRKICTRKCENLYQKRLPEILYTLGTVLSIKKFNVIEYKVKVNLTWLLIQSGVWILTEMYWYILECILHHA